MKIYNLNKDAWDHAVDEGDNPYTDAVSPEEIVKAKQGDWKEVLEQRIRNKYMFHFSHTMETQLGGILKAGFVMTDFYEDRRPEEDGNPIRHYMPSYYVARAQKICLREK